MMSARSALAFCLLAAADGLVANRNLESSAVPLPTDYSWTAWFSEEEGYSENRHYAIQGAHCRGKYCDDLQLYQGYSGEIPTSSDSSSWTSWFSEESTSHRSCPSNHIVTQMQCSGKYCDNKRLRCEMVSSTFTLGTPVWESNTFSEEGSGQYMCSIPYGVVVGWSCSGKYCDNQKLQCAPLTAEAQPQAAATFSWTDKFGSDQEYSPASNFPITAVSCYDSYCGSLKLYQGTSGSDIEVASSSYWTDTFSEEGGHTGSCKQDYVVTRVSCTGKNCDDKKLKCNMINSEKNIMSSEEYVSARFSEEGSHVGHCPPDGYYLTGMQCFDKYCDDLQLICKKVELRSEVPSDPAAAPVGMWMNLGQYFKSTPRTTSITVCTEDSQGQQASRERTQSFSNEVEMSLLIKETAGVEGVASEETEFGLAYTASTETSKAVSETIESSTTLSECITEEISCNDDCWDAMSTLQPEATSAALWQWAVVQQGDSDPLRHLGTFVFVPYGYTPFCPPGTQMLGDLSMTECKPGTFPTQRRLLEPMQWV